MNVKDYQIRLTGTTPLVLHSNRCVDPLDPLKKQIAAITGKRKKTDADHLAIRKLEFQAGLYYCPELGPIVPSSNLRAMLIAGARKDKNGKQFESGIFILDDAPIQYDGPRKLADLLDDERFHWSCVVGNQRNSIIRTRPRFKEWKVEFGLKAETSLVSQDMLENALGHCELEVGLCDARSIGYGRFEAAII